MRSRARRCRRPGRRTRRCPTRRMMMGPRRLRRRRPEWASESEAAVSVQGRGTSRTWIPWWPIRPARLGRRSPTSPVPYRPVHRPVREKSDSGSRGSSTDKDDAAPFTPVSPLPALIELTRHYPVGGASTTCRALIRRATSPQPVRSRRDRRSRIRRPSAAEARFPASSGTLNTWSPRCLIRRSPISPGPQVVHRDGPAGRERYDEPVQDGGTPARNPTLRDRLASAAIALLRSVTKFGPCPTHHADRTSRPPCR